MCVLCELLIWQWEETTDRVLIIYEYWLDRAIHINSHITKIIETSTETLEDKWDSMIAHKEGLTTACGEEDATE